MTARSVRSGKAIRFCRRRARRLQPGELQLAGQCLGPAPVASNMGLTVAYFRTWYGGFQVLDNTRAVTPADYDPFCITAPTDSRLPSSVSGKQFCGLYDINPAKFGQVNFLRTQASHYGKMSEVFDGVDVTIGARFGQGGQVQGGVHRAHGDRQLPWRLTRRRPLPRGRLQARRWRCRWWMRGRASVTSAGRGLLRRG